MIPSQNTTRSSEDAKAAAGILWLQKQSVHERWALTQADRMNLLGGIPRRTLTRYESEAAVNRSVNLSRDTLERLSVLLGIHKALALVAPTGQEYAMFNRRTFGEAGALFGGKSIRDFLLSDGSMQSLYVARRYLNAKRG